MESGILLSPLAPGTYEVPLLIALKLWQAQFQKVEHGHTTFIYHPAGGLVALEQVQLAQLVEELILFNALTLSIPSVAFGLQLLRLLPFRRVQLFLPTILFVMLSVVQLIHLSPGATLDAIFNSTHLPGRGGPRLTGTSAPPLPRPVPLLRPLPHLGGIVHYITHIYKEGLIIY